MSQATFSGPVRTGTLREGPLRNVGDVILKQFWTYDIPNLSLTSPTGVVTAMTLAAGAFNSIMYIPSGSSISDIWCDVDVVYNQGTSAAATIGSAAGGTQYSTTFDLKAATGRLTPTYTAAQLLLFNNTPVTSGLVLPSGVTASALYLRITSVGPAATTGHGFIYVRYQQ